MNALPWTRLEELFASAKELTGDARRRFVDGVAEDDPELAAELISLLEHADAEGDGFLEHAAVLFALGRDEELAPEPASGERLGPFELLGVLGEGGMGVVHLAREDNLDRRVALKLLRRGMSTAASEARFEREARTLARLHHPGIAQVHGAGTLDAGQGPQPYFAMELVDGLPLTEHADREGLDLRARLGLLAEVADALDHAHARGVVHRDLKPSNVLVDRSSGRPQPKVLDFGVARLLDEDRAGPRTLPGQLVGTLAYMAPEQAEHAADAVSPATDVYGLGALGYELVTGKPPIDVSGVSILEAARRVREEEPLPAGRIRAEAQGEVEIMLARALAKDPGRRYGSAAELARDLRRFLADEPILARPPGKLYRARKFARRHRTLVLATLVVLTTLAGAAGVSLRKAGEAARERDAAREQRQAALESWHLAESARAREEQQRNAAQIAAARAQAVVGFMRRMLEDVHASRGGRDVRVSEMLDRTAAHLSKDVAGYPAVELEMRTTLGVMYQSLYRYAEAERELELARALALAHHGPLGLPTLEVQSQLGHLRAARGETAAALELLEDTFSRAVRSFGEEHLLSLTTARRLAIAASAVDAGRALELLRRSIEVAERTLGELHDETLQGLHQLGLLLVDEGQVHGALEVLQVHHRRTLEAHGRDDFRSALSLGGLANVLRDLGRNAEAIEAYRESLELHLQALGEEDPRTLTAMNNLGSLLQKERQHEEAEEILTRAIALSQAQKGPEHADTLIAMNNLAVTFMDTGRFEEATLLHTRILEIKQRTLGPEHRSTLITLFNLALLDHHRRDFEAAERAYTHVLELAERVYPAGHWWPFSVLTGRAAALDALQRFDEAGADLARGYEGTRSALGPGHPRTRDFARRLANLLGRQDRIEEAEVWSQRAQADSP